MTVITGPTSTTDRATHLFARIPLLHRTGMALPTADIYEPPVAIVSTAAWEKSQHPTEDFASAIAQRKWDLAYNIITDYELLTGDVDLAVLAPQLMSAFQSSANTTLDERTWMIRVAQHILETIPFFEISPAMRPLRAIVESALVQSIFTAAPVLEQKILFDCCNTLQQIASHPEPYQTAGCIIATGYAIGIFKNRFPDIPLDISRHTADIAIETRHWKTPLSLNTLMQYTQDQPEALRPTAWRVVGEFVSSNNSHKMPQTHVNSICTGCADEVSLSFRSARCTNNSVSFCQSCFMQGIRPETSSNLATHCPCGCKQVLCYVDYLLVGLSHQNAEKKAIENLRQAFSHTPEWINCNNPTCNGGALRTQENLAPWNILQQDSVLKSACCLCQSDCGISLTVSFDEYYIKRMLVSLGPWTYYFGALRNALDGVWLIPGYTGEHGIREAYPPQLAGVATEKGPDCEHMTTEYRTQKTGISYIHWYWCSGAVPRTLLGYRKLPELSWYLDNNCQLFLPERSPIIAPLGGYRVRDTHGNFISLYNPITFDLDAQNYRTHALTFLSDHNRKTPLPPWFGTAMGSGAAQRATTRHALIDILEKSIPNHEQWRQWRPVHAFLLTFEAYVVRETYLRRSELLRTYKSHVRESRV